MQLLIQNKYFYFLYLVSTKKCKKLGIICFSVMKYFALKQNLYNNANPTVIDNTCKCKGNKLQNITDAIP